MGFAFSELLFFGALISATDPGLVNPKRIQQIAF
jgi:NhaP-type Na+/H+ or K+/H+ antiporter